jgi:16S rRNA (cytosine1402-N4)-methyltransferase
MSEFYNMAHRSVLLKEVIDGLEFKAGDIFLDCTLGLAGHSLEVCRRHGKGVRIIAIDQDAEEIDRAEKLLSEAGCKAQVVQDSFRNLDKALQGLDLDQADKMLFDIGVSSEQLDESGRGFSFKRDEPLLMTMKKDPGEDDLTARVVVNTFSEQGLADIIYAYGEERYAKRIARVIVEEREKNQIETTFDLVRIIESAVPSAYKRGKIHFATRSFQGIRIAVNDELGALREGLAKGFEYLSTGGRMAVISFHSLEDRIVKNFFRDLHKEGKVKLLNKKPIIAGDAEKKENPRSRSAKLRIIEKI